MARLQTEKTSKKSIPAAGTKSAAVAGLFLNLIPTAMRELRKEAKSYASGNLTLPQFRALAHIGCQLDLGGGATNKNLAESLGVSVAASSRMVDLLAKRGLVTRQEGAKDRREIELLLTEKGQAEFAGVRELIHERLEERLRGLSPSDLKKAEVALQGLEQLLKLLGASPLIQ